MSDRDRVLVIPDIVIEDIDAKFNTLMRDPYYVRISADNLGLEGIHHFYYTVKTDKVKHQIFCNKISRLVEVLSRVTFEQCLVFSNYQTGAEEISLALTKDGFSNQLIAGNMAQKDRSQAMADFRECRFRVLISTDVTARGIDNEHVDLVVNMDLPVNTLGNPDPHTYLHRAGRAGRFGKYGSSISIIATQKDHMFIQDLLEKYQVEVREGPPYSQISELLRRSKLPVDTAVPNTATPNTTDPNGVDNPAREAQTNGNNKPALSTESEQDLLETEDLEPVHCSSKTKELVISTSKKCSSGATPDSVFDSWSTDIHHRANDTNNLTGNAVTDLAVLRSNVKVTKKMKPDQERKGEAPDRGSTAMDGDEALSSLGSLGKLPSESQPESGRAPSEDDSSVFNFSSLDVGTYMPEDPDLAIFSSILAEEGPQSSNPSTGSSKLQSDNDGVEISRSRRASKNQKKARKPPKSLNMASPKGQSNRRAQSAAAEFANTNILSPHTPKWRSEAVSTTGCIIHSKAINVKFLLENYLCLKYDFSEKTYDSDYRGYLPPKFQILQNSSTALCEVPTKCNPDKIPLSRFVSRGFVASNSELDPLMGRRITPPRTLSPKCVIEEEEVRKPCCVHEESAFDDPACSSFNSMSSGRTGCHSTSSFGSARQPCCVYQRMPPPPHAHRPTDIPHLCREQSKDSGVYSYTSPFGGYPGSAPPCGTPPLGCYPPSYWWPPYPPMYPYPYAPPPPPRCCASCSSPQHRAELAHESARRTPCGRERAKSVQGHSTWSNAWDKAWEQ